MDIVGKPHLILRQPQLAYNQKIIQYYDQNCSRYGISAIYRVENEKESFECVADACVDFYLYYNRSSGDCGVELVGPHDNLENIIIRKGFTYIIIRFMPGYMPFRNSSIKEIKGSVNTIYDYPVYRTLLEQIVENDDFAVQCSLIIDFMIKNNKPRYDFNSSIVRTVSGLLITSDCGCSVSELENQIGYTSRYLNKILNNDMGYSIQSLSKIIRVQSLADYLTTNVIPNEITPSYSDLAGHFGYCDQSHMIREFKRYFNMTPKCYSEKFCSITNKTKGFNNDK